MMAGPARDRLAELVRTLATSMLDPAAIAPLRGERDILAAVRTPQESPWVVGVVSGRPAVGATTTAIGAATVLAALRDDGVALVDVRAADARLSDRLGRRPAPRLPELGASLPGEVPRVAGVYVVDGPAAGVRMPDAEFRNAVDVLTFHHRYVLLDIGDDGSDLADAALSCVDIVVLVTDAGRDAAGGKPALDRVLRAVPGAYGTVAAAIVGGRGADRRRTADRLTLEFGRAVVIGRDARPVEVLLTPWWRRKDGRQLRADKERVDQLLLHYAQTAGADQRVRNYMASATYVTPATVTPVFGRRQITGAAHRGSGRGRR